MSTDSPSPATPRPFQAEVSRLLHLMVHSVYTEKDVFLRELISNASDACDKLRYEAIARPELIGDDARLAIRIETDKEAGRLVIADNGIGMNDAELAENLGTIARSGTRAFLERLGKEGEGSALIGQFGVGFYAAFMVADHIEVVSRKAGEDAAWLWTSDGASGFTIAPASETDAAKVPRGTRITLHLKDDSRTFLDDYEIERIVKTYSDHILFPIELIGADGAAKQLNSASALWQRSKSEVKPDEYTEVYRSLSGQLDQPALTVHYKAEGRQSYAALLFVPTQRPFDLFDVERKGRVKLYVKRVFITEDAALLPGYLRFVRGVIDSEDVPLNISREMLQNNPAVTQIRRAVTTKVISELETFANKEPEKFTQIWETFGQVLKEGIYEDFERRDQLLKLARFRSTAGDGWRSLSEYVAAMREGQTEIYYLVGESLDRLKSSPQLEAAKERGVEVLLLADPVDAFWTTAMPKFADKAMKSLSQGDVDLSAVPLKEEAAKPKADAPKDVGDLISSLKAALGDEVDDVKVSQRLVSSPACLVATAHGPDRTLERMLQRQQRGINVKPILEINPGHPLIAAIDRARLATDQIVVDDLAHLLLDQARIVEGELPTDPARFTERLNRYLVAGLAVQNTEGRPA
ncbi:MAG: molecular chaperone HtpG [Hyphomicrobium sp. SCN 65-11]|nr:MAG: molecular chaperone HtpG [Hyphomicrobium sp. SCN 65-11]